MQQIGRYRILGELGRGAMGVVYGALDPTIDRHVAIKTIRLTEVGDSIERERLEERLIREARSVGTLSHPGIVVVYDAGREGEIAYIAMECVNGPTLERVLGGDPLPAGASLLGVFRQTAEALDYAHKKGIVHRDIKPANVMIHEDGQAKITDFGVAKVSSSHGATQAGAVLGTPNYMAPEQVEGKSVDGRADQFSLGVIAYQMLTGEKPFEAEQVATLLYKIVSEEPVPAHKLNPTLAWQVGVVIGKALAKDPAARYATCTDFFTALEGALRTSRGWKPMPRGSAHNLPTVVSAPVAARPPAPRPARPERQERGGHGALWGVLLGILAVGVVFIGARQWLQQEAPRAPATEPAAPVASQPAEVVKPSPMPPSTSAPAATPEAKQEPSAETKPEPPPEPAPVEEPAPTPPVAARPPATKPAPARKIPSTPPAVVAAEQTVQVVTNPPGATVIFDDGRGRSCKTPCSVRLAGGRHTLAATLAGYRRELRIFEVAGQAKELFVNLSVTTGSVLVVSDPPGASILVNGQPRKETTPATLVLPVGRYNLEVVKNGKRSDQDFDLKEGAAVKISFSLN